MKIPTNKKQIGLYRNFYAENICFKLYQYLCILLNILYSIIYRDYFLLTEIHAFFHALNNVHTFYPVYNFHLPGSTISIIIIPMRIFILNVIYARQKGNEKWEWNVHHNLCIFKLVFAEQTNEFRLQPIFDSKNEDSKKCTVNKRWEDAFLGISPYTTIYK